MPARCRFFKAFSLLKKATADMHTVVINHKVGRSESKGKPRRLTTKQAKVDQKSSTDLQLYKHTMSAWLCA